MDIKRFPESSLTLRLFGILALPIFFLLNCTCMALEPKPASDSFVHVHGAIVRGDTTKKTLALVFTGGDYGEGGKQIKKSLKIQGVKASFFFTGDFYRNKAFRSLILSLKADGHYLGAHSDKHLLYCDWTNRNQLLVTKSGFLDDLDRNYREISRFGINRENAHYFLPPYEWYNDSISQWTKEAGFQLINFTQGTLSNADYTTPDMANYRSADEIYRSIITYEENAANGLNGFILLIHIGTAPERTDKFYYLLDDLLLWLKQNKYSLVRVDQLLK